MTEDAHQPVPGGMDLDGLLDQFERETAPKQPTEPAPSQTTSHTPTASKREEPADLRTLLAGAQEEAARLFADPSSLPPEQSHELRGKLNQLSGAVAQINSERRHQLDKSDFDKVVAKAQEAIAEYNVPEDFAERWLMSESLKDMDLRVAFDNRYRNPDTLRTAEHFVRKAIERLRKAAAAVPDRETTEDVAAVAAAVRGSSAPPKAGPPPKLGGLSNRDFNKYAKENFGFDPGL